MVEIFHGQKLERAAEGNGRASITGGTGDNYVMLGVVDLAVLHDDWT